MSDIKVLPLLIIAAILGTAFMSFFTVDERDLVIKRRFGEQVGCRLEGEGKRSRAAGQLGVEVR